MRAGGGSIMCFGAMTKNVAAWPDSIDVTLFGSNFLRADTCDSYNQGDPLAYKIFAHDVGIELLKQKPSWATDSTFFSCPEDFYQLFMVGHRLTKFLSHELFWISISATRLRKKGPKNPHSNTLQ
ncbi:unnamed protein product, partial [Mesorhabditis belari]|uniref:Uncharacterized protein n=1 Tax=Mesorhabditis belari TaxID=2138241 RepID=A0AAF3J8Q0_9BILA